MIKKFYIEIRRVVGFTSIISWSVIISFVIIPFLTQVFGVANIANYDYRDVIYLGVTNSILVLASFLFLRQFFKND